MRATDLAYELPPELIAQHAAEPRDSARLLVYDRAGGAIRHRLFRDLSGELSPGDLLVVNDTRVLPVRVRARRATGGAAEVLLLEPAGDGSWEALVRPYRRLREGEVLEAGDMRVTIVERLGEGRVRVRVSAPGTLEQALAASGEMPLPPYITEPLGDPADYQTVYAQHPGSAAAPTAGLHFSERMWDEIRRDHEVASVTLDVGLDTFRPLAEEVVEDHPIHSERYRVPEPTAAAVERARSEGRRIVAVGTTSVRVLETVFGEQGAAARGAHPAADHARVPVPRHRGDDHELPPAAVDPAGAGDGVRGGRADARPVPYRRVRALPLLQLRRREPDPVSIGDFELVARDGGARAGLLETAHGVVETPVFMPVGTKASVKALLPSELRDLGAQIVLGNTYHLHFRPGADLIADLGGLHRFMAWDGPILTDSGGFQVFSLRHTADRVDDDGVTFQSVYDGSRARFTPELAMEVQRQLGSDIAMAFDECTRADVDARAAGGGGQAHVAVGAAQPCGGARTRAAGVRHRAGGHRPGDAGAQRGRHRWDRI